MSRPFAGTLLQSEIYQCQIIENKKLLTETLIKKNLKVAMKVILLFLSLVINSICFAQIDTSGLDVETTLLIDGLNSITPDSAKYHIDELTTICGIVSGTHTTATQTTLINFGNPFPNNSFTAAIMAKDTAKFSEYNPIRNLENLKVCVTGRIRMYKDKPEIILKSANQIRIPAQETLGK